jgi:hypothetical protein
MGVQATVRNNTRNQLFVDFQVQRFCIFNNQFIPGVLKNNTGVSAAFTGGIFVARDTTTADQVLPVTGNIGAPVIPVLAVVTATSTLAATTYFIVQTAITPYGESPVSPEASLAISGTTQSIGVTGTVVPGATGYKTYIGTSAGAEGHYVTSVSPNVTITSPNGTTAGTPPAADTTGNLANAIGIWIQDGSVTLASNATVPGSIVIDGVIDATMITMPLNTTLDTTVGKYAFKDIINGLGFKLDQSTVDNTKFDN